MGAEVVDLATVTIRAITGLARMPSSGRFEMPSAVQAAREEISIWGAGGPIEGQEELWAGWVDVGAAALDSVILLLGVLLMVRTPPRPAQTPSTAARAAPATQEPAGRYIVDPRGNVLREPVGGKTVGNPAGTFVETRFPNGSPYQQLHGPHGHCPRPHGHGFRPGGGVNQRGPSLDPLGRQVPPNSPQAHWPVRQ